MKLNTRVMLDNLSGLRVADFDRYNPQGTKGRIISFNGKYGNPIIVEWDNGIRNSYTENNLKKL